MPCMTWGSAGWIVETGKNDKINIQVHLEAKWAEYVLYLAGNQWWKTI